MLIFYAVNMHIGLHFFCIFMHFYVSDADILYPPMDGRNLAPFDGWFILLFHIISRVSTLPSVGLGFLSVGPKRGRFGKPIFSPRYEMTFAGRGLKTLYSLMICSGIRTYPSYLGDCFIIQDYGESRNPGINHWNDRGILFPLLSSTVQLCAVLD